MSPRVARYLAKLRTHQVREEMSTDGKHRFVATFSDLPGCIAQGATADGAVTALHQLLPAYLDAMIDVGGLPPEVGTELVAPASVNFHSGVVTSTGTFSTSGLKISLQPV